MSASLLHRALGDIHRPLPLHSIFLIVSFGLAFGWYSSDARAQVMLDGVVKPVAAAEAIARPSPPSLQKGLVPTRVDVQLRAPDLTQILIEDQELLDQQKVRRVGIRRDLPTSIAVRQGVASHGAWRDFGDEGSVWTVTLESEQALTMRVRLEGLRLPDGARLWVYDPNDPNQFVGPVSSRRLRAEPEYWTASIFAARVTLELLLPAGADRRDVDLRIDEIAHGHVPLDEIALEVLKEDTCYNDVLCNPVWHLERDGTALILTVTPFGTLQCTGCLLNDFDGETWEDYFLTANHCLSGNNTNAGTQAAASTMEFYWFFQTATCNGTPPTLGSVPRTTGGADLIHSASQAASNDAAFVRIRLAAPGGVGLLGWTTGSPPVGEDTVGIHHPDGTYKRISFGDITGSDSNYWTNVWNNGSTEGGSSGSPLMDSSRRVIGQLFGGGASCSNMSAPDYYGRFNVTYPHIARWLDVGGTIHVDGSYSGVEEGTPTKPFDTVNEGYNFAWGGSRIQIQGGTYSETLTMTKHVTLLGANGTVTIGN